MSLDPSENFESQRGGTLTAADLPSWQAVEHMPIPQPPQIADPLQKSGTKPRPEPTPEELAAVADRPSKFPVRKDLNAKLHLWKGDICRLAVGAIVCPTNDDYTDRSGLSGWIHRQAGPELATECSMLDPLRTGEVSVTAAYRLPARHVIHTVAPRYKPQYRTAAENALHHCYRNAFTVIKEQHIGSIAYPTIHSSKSYPREDACHIAIRTVRRQMERFGDGVDAVVLVVPTDADYAIYASVLALYFPRNEAEEQVAKLQLPADTGNELGETVVEERRIRIAATPVATAAAAAAALDEALPPVFYESVYTGKRDPAFATMKPDLDAVRMRRVVADRGRQMEMQETQASYEALLKKARAQDLADIHRRQIIYQAGKDQFNRPVIAVVGKHFVQGSVDPDRLLLYAISFLDPIVAKDYVLLYVHTDTSGDNHPDLNWLRVTYKQLPYKYHKNIKALYALHPTVWLKALTWFATPFVSKKFWRKYHPCDSLVELFRYLPPERVTVPQFAIDHDVREFGSAALRPSAAPSSPAAASAASTSEAVRVVSDAGL